MTWTRVIRDIQINTFKKNRIDTPEHGVNFLNLFKAQNQTIWSKLGELKTEKQYDWSNVEKTLAGAPLTDVIEMGISAPFSACDCVGVLGKELRRHATEGTIKLLVAVDQANSLYGDKTMIKKADYSRVSSNCTFSQNCCFFSLSILLIFPGHARRSESSSTHESILQPRLD